MSRERVEQHGILTTDQLFVGLVNAGVSPEIASKYFVIHEGGHREAHKRARGKDGEGIAARGSFGFYFESNGYYYQVTAYYSPENWDELSAQDKIDIALANPDPSKGDLDIAGEAQKELARERQDGHYKALEEQGIKDKSEDILIEGGDGENLSEAEIESIKDVIVKHFEQLKQEGEDLKIDRVTVRQIVNLSEVEKESLDRVIVDVRRGVERSTINEHIYQDSRADDIRMIGGNVYQAIDKEGTVEQVELSKNYPDEEKDDGIDYGVSSDVYNSKVNST